MNDKNAKRVTRFTFGSPSCVLLSTDRLSCSLQIQLVLLQEVLFQELQSQL